MAQADFDAHAKSGMPSSAAATGLVDYVLAIEEMPEKLIAYARHLEAVEPHEGPDGTREDTAKHLAKICVAAARRVGHDFSQYKEKTLIRRVQRRMQVLQIDATPDYVERLRKDPREIELLFRELLIGVTHFFRDPAAFEALEKQVIPQIVARQERRRCRPRLGAGLCDGRGSLFDRDPAEGSSRNGGPRLKFQIFATDIDERAVAVARAGRYPQVGFRGHVRGERSSGGSPQDGDHLCPVKEIREMCIFSTHSVIKDPPFSKLDLISCRNLLIYLDPAAAGSFDAHLPLRAAAGRLSVSGHVGERDATQQARVDAVDQKHRIFQRRDIAALPADSVSSGTATDVAMRAVDRSAPLDANGIEKSARRLMEKHLPAYVVVDGNDRRAALLRARPDRYLAPTPGAASLNLFSLIRRKALRPAARAALAKAIATPAAGTRMMAWPSRSTASDSSSISWSSRSRRQAGLCVVAFVRSRAGSRADDGVEP